MEETKEGSRPDGDECTVAGSEDCPGDVEGSRCKEDIGVGEVTEGICGETVMDESLGISGSEDECGSPTEACELVAWMVSNASDDDTIDETTAEELVLRVGDGVEVEQTDVVPMGSWKLSKSNVAQLTAAAHAKVR